MRNLFVLSAFALSACFGVVTACGGDDDDKNTQNQEGSGGGGGDDSGAPGAGGKGEPMTFEECEAAGTFFDDTDDACLDAETATAVCKTRTKATSPDSPTDDPTCGAGCTCGNCQQEMLDCGSDPDAYCEVIVKCAQEKNCTGVGCYAMTTCQAEIDAAPNGGLSSPSVGFASALSDCATAANCPVVCP